MAPAAVGGRQDDAMAIRKRTLSPRGSSSEWEDATPSHSENARAPATRVTRAVAKPKGESRQPAVKDVVDCLSGPMAYNKRHREGRIQSGFL